MYSLVNRYKRLVLKHSQSIIFENNCLHVILTQPVPASAGEESEEDQQCRTIFQQIAGDVSTMESECSGGTVRMMLGWDPTGKEMKY